MAIFTGFSTINRTRKFTLTDLELIKRDLINALSIRKGEVPGLPWYGSDIWSYVFEPHTESTEIAILDEVRRVIESDPRIKVGDQNLISRDHTVIVETVIYIDPDVTPIQLSLNFDETAQAVFVE